ncbi:MAG: hypothetical protein J1D87_07045 [Lachnospiraceae bacterium]|nr:hypothetical protein [Lachnospiraceae bacterium]
MKYGNEGMDLKKLLLFLIYRFWIIVLAAVIGAVLGGGIYLFHNVVLENNREYRAESKVYLNFAPDETGEVYQYYNGYTWNDLMSTDLILDKTMSYLPDDYTAEEVISATLAEILSDVRLLTITITTSDVERTARILEATDKALVDMGQREKEFIDIEIIKETEPKLLVTDSRLLQAVLVGLVIALALVLLGMALVYILDDRIYVPGDLKCVTQLPFVGFSFTQETDELGQRFQNDLEKNLEYLTQETGGLTTLELGKDKDVSEQISNSAQADNAILLVIPYGKIDRSSLAYRIEQLSLRKCNLAGIIIKDADMRFMKWYYNHL